MPDTIPTEQSFDEFDEINYPRPEVTEFERVVDRAMSRRDLLGRGLGLGAAAFVMGTTALTPMA
jgi:secreted PhoX family phosphatase